MEVLRSDNKCDIFSIKEEAVLEEGCTYLEGLLSLIFREFLFIIQTLGDDLIENVQIRSVYTLGKIKQFLDRLSEELNQVWVRENMKVLSEEDLKNVEKQVELELSRKAFEVDEEKVDTELMENIITPSEETLPDLGGNIPELDINSESANKNKDNKTVPEIKVETVKIVDNNEVKVKTEESTTTNAESIRLDTAPDHSQAETKVETDKSSSGSEKKEHCDSKASQDSEQMEVDNESVQSKQ